MEKSESFFAVLPPLEYFSFPEADRREGEEMKIDVLKIQARKP